MCNICAIYFSFLRKICYVQHIGEIIEKAVRESAIPINTITKRLGKSRRWMYHVFANYNTPIDTVLKIGKVIHYDFSEDIKELSKFKTNDTDEAHNHSAEYWKDKYLQLLEKYNALLESTK